MAHRCNVEALHRHFPDHCLIGANGMSNKNCTVKFCKKCATETERYANGQCKPCVKVNGDAWRSGNLERKKATDAARRAANQDRIKATDAAYRAANPERIKASVAAWRAANPERKKATNDAWRAANSEKVKVNRDAWAKANPEALRIKNQNRRALRKENGGQLSKGLAKKLFALQKGKCPCCAQPLGDDYHLDHIMPLALGGANEDWNMQLLRSTCNQNKHAKHPVEFMQKRGFLL